MYLTLQIGCIECAGRDYLKDLVVPMAHTATVDEAKESVDHLRPSTKRRLDGEWRSVAEPWARNGNVWYCGGSDAVLWIMPIP